jgi:hypothetical protein
MKKIYRILLLLILNVAFGIYNSFSQQITFQKIMTDIDFLYSTSSNKTADGGYILSGENGLVKIDSAGNVQWGQSYDFNFLYAAKQTLDGGYIACGGGLVPTSQNDYVVIRTNAAGDIIWSRYYEAGTYDEAYTLEVTQDSMYIVGGIVDVSISTPEVAYVIKINDQGDTLWTRTFGQGYISKIKQTSDGNFILTGTSYVGSLNAAFLAKITPAGDTLWTKKYFNIGEDIMGDVIQTADGGYALTGRTDSALNNNNLNVYFIRTDSLGNYLWSKSYGSNNIDVGVSLKQTDDGGFIIAGTMQGGGGGGTNCSGWPICFDGYLIRTNSSGDTLWTKMYGTDRMEQFSSVEITNDKGYLLAGKYSNDNTAFYGAYLVKTDSLGNSSCHQYNTNTVVKNLSAIIYSGVTVGSGGIIYPAQVTNYSPFITDSIMCISTGVIENDFKNQDQKFSPNPLTIQSKLTFKNPNKEKYLFTLYDITGRVTETVSTTTNEIILTKGSKPAGVYLFNLMNEETGERWRGKIVVAE